MSRKKYGSTLVKKTTDIIFQATECGWRRVRGCTKAGNRLICTMWPSLEFSGERTCRHTWPSVLAEGVSLRSANAFLGLPSRRDNPVSRNKAHTLMDASGIVILGSEGHIVSIQNSVLTAPSVHWVTHRSRAQGSRSIPPSSRCFRYSARGNLGTCLTKSAVSREDSEEFLSRRQAPMLERKTLCEARTPLGSLFGASCQPKAAVPTSLLIPLVYGTIPTLSATSLRKATSCRKYCHMGQKCHP